VGTVKLTRLPIPRLAASSNPVHGGGLIRENKNECDVLLGGVKDAKARPVNLGPDARRETAQMAAKERWANWARKKAV
jgi:hypothetical protein